MSFCDSIPSSVSVADFSVRVLHAGQPVICSVCHESVHQPLACPFSSTVTLPVSTISAPVLSVPPTTIPVPVSPVTAVSTPVSTSVPPSLSVTSALVPVLSHSIGASSSRPFTSTHVPSSPITACSLVSADIKRLSRLLMNKARQYTVFHKADKGHYYTLHLDALSVFKICQVIIKTHKLNVSEDEARGVPATVAYK